MSTDPPEPADAPEPEPPKPRIRLDLHGRFMITITVVMVLLTAGTLVASALGAIGPSRQAGARVQADRMLYRDSGQPVEARVADLLPRMSLAEKLGQLTLIDRNALANPQDLATYRVGAVMSVSGAAVGSSPAGLADGYDDLERAALSTPLGIPIIYGVDSAPVPGATIFPHTIALGAGRDPALVEKIGRATAEEIAGTGIDWSFGPCACLARGVLGSTAESFGEQPEAASPLTASVGGMQGDDLNKPGSVLATARYYPTAGDTTDLVPLQAAIQRGVGAVMVSFGTTNGQHAPADQHLITDVIKGELRFGGFVVTDRAGIDQVDHTPGLSGADIAGAINAGADMVQVTGDYTQFITLLRAEVEAGRIPTSRIDDATRRVLTKKFQLGLFERTFAERSLIASIGSQAHRDLARDAVRKSQVLLKNTGGTLPLAKRGGKLFVAGSRADDLAAQSGGTDPRTFKGTTILQGIRQAAAGTAVTYRRDGSGIDRSYRAAIAVVGGTATLDAADTKMLARLHNSGVPVIAVLVSGRPVNISDQMRDFSALVEAWLPGSEGEGVADVLFGDYHPTGKLPVSWPRLFAYGTGMSYGGKPAPATSSAAPAPVKPPPTSAVACAVRYQVTSEWADGFVADVRITAGSAALNGWTLRFTFPGDQKITNPWNAVVTQDGAKVSAANQTYNATVPARGQVDFGFQASYSGKNTAPPAVTLNGALCNLSK